MATDEDAGRAADGGGAADSGLAPGLEHLQQAALEAVRAARAMLDAAESAIRDPAALESVVRTAAGVARTATETVAGFAAGTARPPAGAPDRPTTDEADTGYHDISVD